MTLYFSTDWTLKDSLLTEVDNVITLHPQEIGYNGENVCLIATNELNEVIATSGCGEEEPLITERFIRFWAESGFPSQMDIEISELYLEDEFVDEELLEHEMFEEETFEEFLLDNGLSLQFPHQDLQEIEETWHSMNHLYELVCEDSDSEEDEPNSAYYNDWQNCESKLMRLVAKLKSKYNQLPSPPIILETFVDKYNNVYGSQRECEEGEADYQRFLDCEEFYNEHPTGGEHSFQQMIVEEGLQRKDKGQYLDFINNENEQFSQEVDKLMDTQIEYWNDEYLTNLEKEARKPLENWFEKKTHNLIKRKDLPKRVDFEMLVNSSHLIWNAAHLLGLGQDPNNIVIIEGQEAVKNLELFLSLMPNPKFATVSSFQIEKHGKN